MASYSVNPDAVAQAERLIDSRQYVLDSDWGQVQPSASEQNAFLRRHSWEEYARWHLGLTDGASDQTKARYAFIYGDFRRIHRMGIIASMYRAAEWRHKEVADGGGRYHGQMAVLVKPNGRLGDAYMAAIRPFRHLIVYPAMLREGGRTWRTASTTAADGA